MEDPNELMKASMQSKPEPSVPPMTVEELHRTLLEGQELLREALQQRDKWRKMFVEASSSWSVCRNLLNEVQMHWAWTFIPGDLKAQIRSQLL